MILSFGSLKNELNKDERSPKRISFLSAQETGFSSRNLLGYGNSSNPELSIDQREDDGRSLTFDSFPLTENYELFGFPIVKLNLSSSSGLGLICVLLCMIDEKTSSSILI